MLENSLKIREKYINKLKAKVDSLSESINLLNKVDRKLLIEQQQIGGAKLNKLMRSYSNIQNGGTLGPDGKHIDGTPTDDEPAPAVPVVPDAPVVPGAIKDILKISEIEKATLRKKAEILLQRKKLDEINKNIDALSKNFAPINAALLNVRDLINSIHIRIPKMNQASPPDISHLPFVYQYNIYHKVPYNQLHSVAAFANEADPRVKMNQFDKEPKENENPIVHDEKVEIAKFHGLPLPAENDVSYAADDTKVRDKYNEVLKEFVDSLDRFQAKMEESPTPSPAPPAPPAPQAGGSRRYFELPNALTETPY